MMSEFYPIRTKPSLETYKKGDVLVLFGELFQRGYANGLVEEAEKKGMIIIRSTVGRRDKEGLRPLNADEMAAIPQPFVNIPIEAGFDMEPADSGMSPVDQLKDIKLSDWDSCHLNWKDIESSHKKGQQRFEQQLKKYFVEIQKHIPKGANVLFAHLMAGGVPRAKIVMPLMNRAFKGTGERYLASETFWNSEIGQLCSKSFLEVTAETYRSLLNASADLKKSIEASGGQASYLAYGYHGTEVLVNNKYQWQTYTPYLQGWAKKQLEQISIEFTKKGYKSCVYNCPEILTNSSSIFQGVEISLYPLVRALLKESPHSPKTNDVIHSCRQLLKNPNDLDQMLDQINTYMTHPVVRQHSQFEKWPQHSSAQQLESMLHLSNHLFDLHVDHKAIMTGLLSEVVFEACGKIMLNDSFAPQNPVAWIGHDIIAQIV